MSFGPFENVGVQVVLILILAGLLVWWFKFRPQSY
jgi:hypothetical protein